MISILHLVYAEVPRDLMLPITLQGNESAILDSYEQGHYRKVAEIETDDLVQAYRDTQNIECDWTQNESVLWTESESCRSTTVGDLMIHGDTIYIITPDSYKQLNARIRDEYRPR